MVVRFAGIFVIVAPRPTLLYFCDETHKSHPYMGVAGLAITPATLKRVVADILSLNAEYGVFSEVKWSTAKRRRNDIYRAYIDLFFKLIDEKMIHFHLRLVPMEKYEHSISGSRGYVDTISKQFYQLLLHRPARYYGKKCRIMIRPDKGDCTSYLQEIFDGLNSECKSYHRLLFEPFDNIEPVDSRREPIMQLLDVNIGALCAARNETHLDGTLGEYKRELVAYALSKIAPLTIKSTTRREQRRLSIWNVTPRY